MKKISFLFSLLLAIFLSSCNHSSDMADQIIGKWEMVHYKESSWWYYYNEDGTQTETYTLDEEYDVTPEHPEWAVLRFTNMFMSLIDGGAEVDDILLGVPFPYTFEGDKLSSLIMSYDHTDYLTVSFKDDDTMVFYVDDSGELEEANYGGYEHYESWVTYRRIK